MSAISKTVRFSEEVQFWESRSAESSLPGREKKRKTSLSSSSFVSPAIEGTKPSNRRKESAGTPKKSSKREALGYSSWHNGQSLRALRRESKAAAGGARSRGMHQLLEETFRDDTNASTNNEAKFDFTQAQDRLILWSSSSLRMVMGSDHGRGDHSSPCHVAGADGAVVVGDKKDVVDKKNEDEEDCPRGMEVFVNEKHAKSRHHQKRLFMFAVLGAQTRCGLGHKRRGQPPRIVGDLEEDQQQQGIVAKEEQEFHHNQQVSEEESGGGFSSPHCDQPQEENKIHQHRNRHQHQRVVATRGDEEDPTVEASTLPCPSSKRGHHINMEATLISADVARAYIAYVAQHCSKNAVQFATMMGKADEASAVLTMVEANVSSPSMCSSSSSSRMPGLDQPICHPASGQGSSSKKNKEREGFDGSRLLEGRSYPFVLDCCATPSPQHVVSSATSA